MYRDRQCSSVNVVRRVDAFCNHRCGTSVVSGDFALRCGGGLEWGVVECDYSSSDKALDAFVAKKLVAEDRKGHNGYASATSAFRLRVHRVWDPCR